MKKQISALAIAVLSVSLAACNDSKETSTPIVLDAQTTKAVSSKSADVSPKDVDASETASHGGEDKPVNGGDDKSVAPAKVVSDFDENNKIGFMLNNNAVYPLSLKVVGSTDDTLTLSFGSKLPIEKPIAKKALTISHDGVTKSFDHVKDDPMSFKVPKNVLLAALTAEAASLNLHVGSNADGEHSQYYEVDLSLEFEGSFRSNALKILQK